MDWNVNVHSIAKSALDHYSSVPPPMLITFDHAHVIFLISNRLEKGEGTLAYDLFLRQFCPYSVHPENLPVYDRVKKFVYQQCRSYVGIARSTSIYTLRSFYFNDPIDATLFKLTFC